MMYSPKKILSLISLFASLICAASAQEAVSQRTEPAFHSYKAVLYLLVGADAAKTGTEVPQQLGRVAESIRGDLQVRDLRLVSTYVGRLGERGSLKYSSVSTAFRGGEVGDTPTFLDWEIAGFETASSGGDPLRVQSFRFGAKLPVRIAALTKVPGQMTAPVSYENIGLTLSRIGLRPNTPTLLGTISLPGSSGTMFLVIDVQSLE